MEEQITKLLQEREHYEQQNIELGKEVEAAKLVFTNNKKSYGRRIKMNKMRISLVNSELQSYGYETGENTPAVASDQPGDVQQNQ